MGVAQWAEASAAVSAGVGRFRPGAHPQEYAGRGGLARRETRVKLGRQPWRLVKRA